MLLRLTSQSSEDVRHEVVKRLQAEGLAVHFYGRHIAVPGANSEDCPWLGQCAVVEHATPFSYPFKLASREFKPDRTIIEVGGVRIGDGSLAVIAGPCAVESAEQMLQAAEGVHAAGAQILRGGAYKPRSSPYTFQGLGQEGLAYLRDAAQAFGLASVTEVMDRANLDVVAEYADILQVGSRNMQNISLLKALGRVDKPILLKRGMAATYEDLLMAAEYILHGGNDRVILCERGIRTFDHFARNTLDLAAVPILHELTHLPVIVDPSHGTGWARLVPPMARAAAAAGADGVMIEVHPNPPESVSDAQQALCIPTFSHLMRELQATPRPCSTAAIS